MDVLEAAPFEALNGQLQDYCQQVPSSNIAEKKSLEYLGLERLFMLVDVTRCDSVSGLMTCRFQGKFGGINLSVPTIAADGGVNTTSYRLNLVFDPIILTDAKKVLKDTLQYVLLTTLSDCDRSMQSARKRLQEHSFRETIHEKHVRHGLKGRNNRKR